MTRTLKYYEVYGWWNVWQTVKGFILPLSQRKVGKKYDPIKLFCLLNCVVNVNVRFPCRVRLFESPERERERERERDSLLPWSRVNEQGTGWRQLAAQSVRKRQCRNHSVACSNPIDLMPKDGSLYKIQVKQLIITHLMMVTNWVIVSSWGTRNLVLSRGGRYFSRW